MKFGREERTEISDSVALAGLNVINLEVLPVMEENEEMQ